MTHIGTGTHARCNSTEASSSFWLVFLHRCDIKIGIGRTPLALEHDFSDDLNNYPSALVPKSLRIESALNLLSRALLANTGRLEDSEFRKNSDR